MSSFNSFEITNFCCYLGADGAACKMFTGAPSSCGICNDTGWAEIAAKNL